jgi:ABC-type lipoprotein export system ATPase subunit
MMIRVHDLIKSYRNPAGGSDRLVLDHLSLDVEKGSSLALMGPSGSGKTTLLNILGTLDTQDSGEYTLNGVSVKSLNETDLLRLRSRSIGFVFQSHRLLPQCTLLENCLLPTLASGLKPSEDFVKELLQQLGVWELRLQKPGELSGGECQRAAVARALINNPDLLLADEPTGSLDASNADTLVDLLLETGRKYGTTLVVATHSEKVASRMDTLYRLENGRLKA